MQPKRVLPMISLILTAIFTFWLSFQVWGACSDFVSFFKWHEVGLKEHTLVAGTFILLAGIATLVYFVLIIISMKHELVKESIYAGLLVGILELLGILVYLYDFVLGIKYHYLPNGWMGLAFGVIGAPFLIVSIVQQCLYWRKHKKLNEE